MAVQVGINGFGRIGRSVFRAMMERGLDINVVAINDLTDTKTLAHLLEYDSVHGKAKFSVSYDDSSIIVDGKKIKILAERNPADLGWGKLGVDVVIESTGIFTKRDKAQLHIDAGAKKVIISAPATDEDLTLVFGVNDSDYDKSKHHIISNASCTTNCMAPVAKILNDTFGIEHGTMMTVHSYTNDQNILDLPHGDLRRARAAGMSIIPTSTGAAKAVTLVIPELKGKLDGMALRVPTPNVSVTEMIFKLGKDVTAEEVNDVLKKASETSMKGVLAFETKPLVSIDYNGNKFSSIVDAQSTKVVGGSLVQVLSWYDNETGYSNRVAELVTKVL